MKLNSRTQEYIHAKTEKIPEAGCWIWMGSVDKQGYGYASLDHKTIKAHRHSYRLFKGEIPEGLFVLHRCDIPSCVNPDHLFVGTCKENSEDAKRKGRTARGSRCGLFGKDRRGVLNGRARLSESQVRDVFSDVRPIKVIAAEYGVHNTTIRLIKNKKHWGHLWPAS